MKYSIIIIGIFLLAVQTLWAQPGGNLGQLELSVTEKYKPQVGNARKVLDAPSFVDTTVKKIPVSYAISSQPIAVSFNPDPISPARIAKIPVETLHKGWVRLGYGFYNTPMVDVYYNSARASNYSFGVYGNHFSSQKGVPDIVYKNNALSGNKIGGYYKRFYNKFNWTSELYGDFRKATYYGLSESLADTSFFSTVKDKPKAPKNWYRTFGVSSSILSNKKGSIGMLNSAALNYYHLYDDFFTRENFIKAQTHFSIPVEDLYLELEANTSYFKTQYDTIDQSQFTLQLKPYVQTKLDDLRFKFGINLYYNHNNRSFTDTINEGAVYFFPEVRLTYPIVQDVFHVYAGIEGNLKQNTISTLSTENIFINPAKATLKPSRQTHIFIGMNGILSANTSYNITGGFKNIKDMGLYYRSPGYDTINPYIFPQEMGVDLMYDNAGVWFVSGELTTHIKNVLELGVGGTLNSYSMGREKKPWHLPAFEANAHASYTIKEKINIKPTLHYFGPREAFDQIDNMAIKSNLKGYLDVNLNVEYLYNSRLSAFIKVYNLLNVPYDYYLGYQAQQINVLLGIGYKF